MENHAKKDNVLPENEKGIFQSKNDKGFNNYYK